MPTLRPQTGPWESPSFPFPKILLQTFPVFSELFPPFAPHLSTKNTVSKFYTARSQALSSAVRTKKHCTALYKIWKLYLPLIYQICQNCQWFPIGKLENPLPARRMAWLFGWGAAMHTFALSRQRTAVCVPPDSHKSTGATVGMHPFIPLHRSPKSICKQSLSFAKKGGEKLRRPSVFFV